MQIAVLNLVLFLLWVAPDADSKPARAVAEMVLLQLYQQAGRTDRPIPVLSISGENKKVAAYYPARHQIVLDEKAYRLCTEMGGDSLNALAFILAHELAHALQAGTEGRNTNFLAYGIQDNDSNRREKAADIQGAFTAYLAGYRVEGVLPGILERIYKAYGLWGKAIPGYPSFEERSNSTREVLALSHRLAEVFEAANYLTVLEHYELASACYTFLLEYYQGRDIYNNLGALQVLQALQYYDEATDVFAPPLELEGLSLLRELERQRGQESLTEAEKTQRRRQLQNALTYFQQALERDKGYLPAVGNMACAFNLLGQPEQALAFLKGRRFNPARNTEAENLQMAYGVSCALKGSRREAETVFRRLLGASDALCALQAQFNLDALKGQAFSYSPPPPFRLPESIVSQGRALEPGAADSRPPLLLAPQNGIRLTSSGKGAQVDLSFRDAAGPIVTLLRWKGKGLPPVNLAGDSSSPGRQLFYNVVASPNGPYIRSSHHGLIVKAGRQGEVEEIVRWVRHRRMD